MSATAFTSPQGVAGPVTDKRRRLLTMMASMRRERESWMPVWRDLADYIQPMRSRFLTTDANRGGRDSKMALDRTATRASQRLAAGLMSGRTSPARPWFTLTASDPELNEDESVRLWLEYVTDRMRDIYAKSNFYSCLPLVYMDEAVFGTAALGIFEDSRDVIRCETYPIGSYMLAQSSRYVVDTFAREFQMSARQIVERFGKENVRQDTLNLIESAQGETMLDVCHIVYPNEAHRPRALDSKYKKWAQCYWEAADTEGKYLEEVGYNEFPIMAPRWSLTGEDVYGASPGMDALPTVKGLQELKKDELNALALMIRPPVNAPLSLKNSTVATKPSGVNFVDIGQQGNGGVRPVFEVQTPLQHLRAAMADDRDQIRQFFFEDLFLMFQGIDNSTQRTAAEIQVRQQEKLLMLGPMMERQDTDLFDPGTDRVFAIMERKGMIPPPPEALAGRPLKVEYISILAQAQKMVAVGNIDTFVGRIGQLGTVAAEALDRLDVDDIVDAYATATSVSPKLVKPLEEANEVRTARARQQQALQAAAMAQTAGKTAKDLSGASLEGDTALSRSLEAVGA